MAFGEQENCAREKGWTGRRGGVSGNVENVKTTAPHFSSHIML
jgi:hypothetical protein